jgi:hypothetical protein
MRAHFREALVSAQHNTGLAGQNLRALDSGFRKQLTGLTERLLWSATPANSNAGLLAKAARSRLHVQGRKAPHYCLPEWAIDCLPEWASDCLPRHPSQEVAPGAMRAILKKLELTQEKQKWPPATPVSKPIRGQIAFSPLRSPTFLGVCRGRK